jgi:hypothetical protein
MKEITHLEAGKRMENDIKMYVGELISFASTVQFLFTLDITG